MRKKEKIKETEWERLRNIIPESLKLWGLMISIALIMFGLLIILKFLIIK